jgi:hypothetical protein
MFGSLFVLAMTVVTLIAVVQFENLDISVVGDRIGSAWGYSIFILSIMVIFYALAMLKAGLKISLYFIAAAIFNIILVRSKGQEVTEDYGTAAVVVNGVALGLNAWQSLQQSLPMSVFR